jgi:hypothetical protein
MMRLRCLDSVTRGGGALLPPWGSTDDGSSDPVTLAGVDGKPQIPLLGLVVAGCSEVPAGFQIDQDSVNSALVTLGVKTHGTDQIGSGHRSLLDQDAAGSNADGDVEGVVDDAEHDAFGIVRDPVVSLEPIVAHMGTVSSPLVQVVGLSHLGVPAELFRLATFPDRLAPLAALRLRPMHQQGEGAITEAMRIIVIHFQICCNRLGFIHKHLGETLKLTRIDKVIKRTTIRCRHVEIRGQRKIYKQLQRFAVAVELKIGIPLGNFNPSIQISTGEEVSALMNPHQFSVFSAVGLDTFVDKICSRSITQCCNNLIKIALATVENRIVLHLGRCSKATKFSVGTIRNRSLSGGGINTSKGLAEHSTGAGATSGQVKDQGLLAQFGVAFGEVQHGCPLRLNLLLHGMGHLGDAPCATQKVGGVQVQEGDFSRRSSSTVISRSAASTSSLFTFHRAKNSSVLMEAGITVHCSGGKVSSIWVVVEK